MMDMLSAKNKINLNILPQPNDETCGPTSLHAVYRYYSDEISLQQVISEVAMVDGGGTLAPLLGIHALKRKFQATIYTYNLQVFDPTWFIHGVDLVQKLNARMQTNKLSKQNFALQSYIDFVSLGGHIKLQDLTPNLIRNYLNRSIPILTGLSSTYLYQCMREYGPGNKDDDIRGEPSGHFVVLSGYEHASRQVLVHDPLYANPFSYNHQYKVSIYRLINAILIGILTFDGNLLIIEPKNS